MHGAAPSLHGAGLAGLCRGRGLACCGAAWPGLPAPVAYAILLAGRLLLGLGESLATVGLIAWCFGVTGPHCSGLVFALVGMALGQDTPTQGLAVQVANCARCAARRPKRTFVQQPALAQDRVRACFIQPFVFGPLKGTRGEAALVRLRELGVGPSALGL